MDSQLSMPSALILFITHLGPSYLLEAGGSWALPGFLFLTKELGRHSHLGCCFVSKQTDSGKQMGWRTILGTNN